MAAVAALAPVYLLRLCDAPVVERGGIWSPGRARDTYAARRPTALLRDTVSAMPRSVRISLWLFIGSVLAAPVVGLLDPRPLRPFPGSSGATVVMVVSFFVVPILSLFFFIAYSAYHRQNWARWVLAVLCTAALATDIPALARDLIVLPVIGVLEATVVCCQSAAIVLLFVPEANRWYRGAAEADGAT